VRLFEKLRKKLTIYLSREQIEAVESAYLFSKQAHEGQTRSSGEPYITHPVDVAGILADMHMDPETIMAALLHDVMEDTTVTKSLIAEQFGNSVADLVDGVSKLTKIKFENKAEAQAENFRKMILAMAKDIRVVLVKLADRLHNMRTLASLRPEKRRRIAQETLEIYVPIANRLGMHNLRIELENLSFQASYPNRYLVLSKAVKHLQGNRKSVVEVIQKALNGALSKPKFNYLNIMGREKHLYSIYRKMRSKHLPLADILDMYAFRIVVDTVEDCYRALGFVHNLYKPVPERFKDYIAIPKANGYQSLHTTLFGPYGVPIEIQIRTQEMDLTADSGVAAHWSYKDGKLANGFLPNERTKAWLDSLLKLQQKAGTSLEFIENVKFDLSPDEVYVFTPKGSIMELPRGATIVDFAYAVHSDIGDHCIAGKIDRHFQPLSTKLNNGQTVEIITATQAHPSVTWLDFVITGKARSSIRHFLKNQQYSETVNLGQELLNNVLRSLKVDSKELSSQDFTRVLTESQLSTVEELYQGIGSGDFAPMLIAKRLLAEHDNYNKEFKISQPISIKGAEGLSLHFAKCCHPIPGDAIIGYFEPKQGIFVHVTTCRQIAKEDEREPEKYLPLRWDEQVKGYFPVDIRITVYNRRGILAEITQTLSKAEIDIEDIKVLEKNADSNKVKFILMVKSRQHLADVIRSLRKLSEVIRITRNTAKRKK